MSTIDIFKREANFIGGKWVQANSGKTLNVTNPANGDLVGTVPNSGKDETARAIAAASSAFTQFSKTSANFRAGLLRKLHDAIMDNQNTLAELLSLEQGKPLNEAMGEIGISAAYVLWFAEECRRIYGELIPSPWPDRRIMVSKQPIGVVAAITPWNFPSSMLARKIAPALGAGCTTVIKPASQTPYSGLAWGVLCEEVGFPAGTINIVTGDPAQIGDEICANPTVRKLTFTGSTRVGKSLMVKCAQTVKKISMELGGNAPFIIFNDADIDRAIEGALVAKYRNSGQTCVCTNRFYAQAEIYDTFVEKLAKRAKELAVGPGQDKGTEQGPLIDEKAVIHMESLISDATEKGAKIVTGGKRHQLGGTFFEPTVLCNATSDMRVAKEEIFGPISPVFKFENEDEVIAAANDTEYGLACYFYTRDLARTYRVMDGLEYGLIGVNEGLIATVEAPFGGLKESGIGKEGGHQGIADYLDEKYVCIGGLGD